MRERRGWGEGGATGPAGLAPRRRRWRRGNGAPAGPGALQRNWGHAPGSQRWEGTGATSIWESELLRVRAPGRGGALRHWGRRLEGKRLWGRGGGVARLSWKPPARRPSCPLGEETPFLPRVRRAGGVSAGSPDPRGLAVKSNQNGAHRAGVGPQSPPPCAKPQFWVRLSPRGLETRSLTLEELPAGREDAGQGPAGEGLHLPSDNCHAG